MYVVFYAEEAAVLKMAEEMRTALNQSAVLVEKETTLAAYLAGPGR